MCQVVLPTNDLAFKKLFSNAEHPEIIQGFLADVLDLHVEVDDIRFANPYSIESYLETKKAVENGSDNAERSSRVRFRETMRDVTVAIIDTGDVTIEMQLTKPKFLMQRLHYYLDDLFTSNYNLNIPDRGDRYASLKPVIAVNIIDFNLFDDARVVHLFRYRDDETFAELFPVLKRIGFFELGKPALAPLADWQQFFQTGKADRGAPPYLRNAASIIAYHNLTGQEKAVVDAVEKAEQTSLAILEGVQERAHAAGRSEGERTGYAVGRSEGERTGRLEIARNLIRDGLPLALVSKYTDLSIEELEASDLTGK